MAVKEKRYGKPYVWNAWAYETNPAEIAQCVRWYEHTHYPREWRERPERVARWEDDGGVVGAAQRGM